MRAVDGATALVLAAEAVCLTQRTHELATALDRARLKARKCEDRLEQLASEIDELSRSNVRLEAELGRATLDAQRLQATFHNRLVEGGSYRSSASAAAELAVLKRSLFWRVAAPMRAISGRVRQLLAQRL